MSKKEKKTYDALKYGIGEIKLLPKEKIQFKAVILDDDGVGDGYTKKSERYPHPDLMKYFKDETEAESDKNLKEYVVKVMGYCKFFDLAAGDKIGKPEQEAFAKLGVVAKQYEKMVTDGITVNGLKLNGTGNTTGVVIMYRYNPNGATKGVELCTPSITLSAEAYGFEEDLATIVGNITEEVFEYDVNKKDGLVKMEGAKDEKSA